MSSRSAASRCEHLDLVGVYALEALSPEEMTEMRSHIASCADCQEELKIVRPVIDAFAAWPTDVVRPSPSASLWDQVARRVSEESGDEPLPRLRGEWSEPDWEEVAPGIACKLLATDNERTRVSMLVRLAPGIEYPPHTHAGVEELHLLEGELWIDDRKLYPGDYSRAEPGTGDKRVWSETGCTCVLITSPADVLS
jgi:hypothetical protein